MVVSYLPLLPSIVINAVYFYTKTNSHYTPDSNVVYSYIGVQMGGTALVWASCYGNLETVRLLLERGAEPNLATNVRLVYTCSYITVPPSMPLSTIASTNASVYLGY